MKTCQGDPYDYYHSQSFYYACQQAKQIVSNANNWCKDATLAGVVIAWIQKLGGLNGWATLAAITGMGFACLL
jgi:hypothetical protein